MSAAFSASMIVGAHLPPTPCSRARVSLAQRSPHARSWCGGWGGWGKCRLGIARALRAAARGCAPLRAAARGCTHVCPPIIWGKAEASTTRSEPTPRTRSSGSSTANGLLAAPMRHEPVRAFAEWTVARTYSSTAATTGQTHTPAELVNNPAVGGVGGRLRLTTSVGNTKSFPIPQEPDAESFLTPQIPTLNLP